MPACFPQDKKLYHKGALRPARREVVQRLNAAEMEATGLRAIAL